MLDTFVVGVSTHSNVGLQMAGFENGRLQTAARAVGLMQAAFEAGLAYAQERKVFGRAVAAMTGVFETRLMS